MNDDEDYSSTFFFFTGGSGFYFHYVSASTLDCFPVINLCLYNCSVVHNSGNAAACLTMPEVLPQGRLPPVIFTQVSQSRTWFPEWPDHLHITRGETSLSWAMTALLPNVSVALLPTTDCPFNITAAAQAGLGSLAPLCTLCCCGFINRTLAVVFMVSLAFAIVVGNVITLTVFVQTRQSRTPQGYLKVSLAIADMMVGVLVVPFSVYTEISLMVTSAPPIWYQGSSTSPATTSSPGGMVSPWQPCMLIGPVFAGCTFVSISTIFLMTMERSVAILRPLHKDSLVTRRRTLLLILLSWAASFLLALAPLIFSSNFTLEYNECSRMCNYSPLLFGGQLPPDANILLLFPAFDFTLLGGTLAVNIVSFTSIRRYSRKRKLLSEGSLSDGGGGGGVGGGGSGGCSHRPSFSDIKAAKTIGILTFAFTASFSPIAVFVLGNVVGYTWCNFSFFAFWILTGNSCCNVIIYSVRDHRFRKGMTLLFQRDHSHQHGEKS